MILCAATVSRSGSPGPAPTSVMLPPLGSVLGGFRLMIGLAVDSLSLLFFAIVMGLGAWG